VDAIRGRIRRGTLGAERDSGTVYVWIDRAETDRHKTSAASQGPSDDQSELIESLRDQVSYLREQLDEERRARTEERRRQDTIIAQLMQRIPELEPPPEQARERRESPETAESPGPRERPFTDEERPQEAGQPRSSTPWWRRVFGG
jgi:hypothetical protein